MATTVNVTDVRNLSGVDSTILDDTAITNIITRVEAETLKTFNIKVTPTITIDMVNIISRDKVNVKKTPLLAVRRIQQNNSSIDLDDIKFKSIGVIRKDFLRFYNYNSYFRRNNMLYVEYYYGYVDVKDDQEFTTSALSAGTSVNITVSDESIYAVDDYIRIKGFDGHVDVAKITATTTNQITVDELKLSHESNSLIEIFTRPSLIDDYILYQCALNASESAIGNTYRIASSYSAPEYSVTKGVPHPHFTSSVDSLTKERDRIRERINADLMRA